MAPPARPFSAASARSYITGEDGSISSYCIDRSGVLGLDCVSKMDRPVPEMVNLLLDAAHLRHENRNVRHPATQAYTLFTKHVATTSSGETFRSGVGSRGTSSGGGIPAGLDVSHSLSSIAGHSSTAVYAWGEASLQSGNKGSSSAARGSGSGERPLSNSPAPTLAVASSFSSAPGAAITATATITGTPAQKVPRGPSPLGLTSPVNRTMQLFSYYQGPGLAGPDQVRVNASATTSAAIGRDRPGSASKATAATLTATANASKGGTKDVGAPPISPILPSSSGGTNARCSPAVSAALRRLHDRSTAPGGISVSSDFGCCDDAEKAEGEGAPREGDRLAFRQVQSASGAGAGSGATAVAAPAAACGAENSRSSGHSARSEVISRASSMWEGAELEVVCLYDSNFQAANRQGQHGVPLRIPVRKNIGPISYLYRWYCKRSTKFRSPITPDELQDAPMIPTDDVCRSVSGRPSGSASSRSNSSSMRHNRPASPSGGGGGTRASGVGPAAAWLRKATTQRAHSGPSIFSPEGAGGVGSAAAAADGERVITSTGRRLNYSLDPVISLSELVDLLEDMEVVPQLATRMDVTRIFNAARQAFTTAAVNAASATACPGSSNAARTSAISHSNSNSSNGKKSQLHTQISVAPASGHDGLRTSSVMKPRPASAATAASKVPGAWSNSISSSSSSNAMKMAANTGYGSADRPASAPRMLSKSISAVSGGSSGSGHATAAIASSAIPRTQPHPEEVRFPVFKDILVRLAVAIACTVPSPAANNTASASAAHTEPGSPLAPNPVVAASASAVSCSSRCRSRAMSTKDAAAAVRRLLERMQLYRSDIRVLKNRLDELARLAKEHALRARDNRWRYVAVTSAVDATQDVAVAADVATLPPAARPGMLVKPLPSWGVLATTPAPLYLSTILTEEDQEEVRYQPAWREFGVLALDLGVLHPGELRRCRLLLYSRGQYALSVRLDGSDAPFCDVTHAGLQYVPPGIPVRVDVTVQLRDVGEVLGELRLLYSTAQDLRERTVIIPVYGMVCPVDAPAAAGRTYPMSVAERSILVRKMAVERSGTATGSVAATVMIPPRRGPSSPTTPLSLSSLLAGYGNSSASMGLHKACAGARLGEFPAADAADSQAGSRQGGASRRSSGDGVRVGIGAGGSERPPPSRASSVHSVAINANGSPVIDTRGIGGEPVAVVGGHEGSIRSGDSGGRGSSAPSVSGESTRRQSECASGASDVRRSVTTDLALTARPTAGELVAGTTAAAAASANAPDEVADEGREVCGGSSSSGRKSGGELAAPYEDAAEGLAEVDSTDYAAVDAVAAASESEGEDLEGGLVAEDQAPDQDTERFLHQDTRAHTGMAGEMTTTMGLAGEESLSVTRNMGQP